MIEQLVICVALGGALQLLFWWIRRGIIVEITYRNLEDEDEQTGRPRSSCARRDEAGT